MHSIGAIIDGTFECLMSVVYNFYYEKILPTEIVVIDQFQQTLGTEYVIVETDFEKSQKVIDGMHKKLSPMSWSHIYNASLSYESTKYMAIFQYIVAGFKLQKNVDRYETLDYVLAVHNLSKNVGREAHALREFIRFAQTKEGVLYADISPKNNVLPIVVEHFSDRLCSERFIIHDVPRNIAAVYDAKETVFIDAPKDTTFNVTEDEQYYQSLWRTFYNSIAIKERINYKLQAGHMPKRFWKHMTEHKLY